MRVLRIATDLFDAVPDDALLKLLRTVNGNPFLLVDVVRGLAAEGIVSASDGTVTLRDRDTLQQERVPSEGLGDRLASKLAEPWSTRKLA